MSVETKEKINIQDILKLFGRLKNEPYCEKINNLELDKNVAKTQILKYVNFLVNDKKKEINYLLLDLCIRQYLTSLDNIYELLNIIYNIVGKLSLLYGLNIQKLINSNEISVSIILDMIRKYYSTSKNVCLMFNILTKYFRFTTKSKFILNVICDYSYYQNILLKKYYKDQQEYTLFEILHKVIDKNNKQDYIDVLDIVKRYNGFSWSVLNKDNRNDFFDIKIDNVANKKLLDDDGINKFVKEIDNKIREINNNNADKDKLIEYVKRNIDICQRGGNKISFMVIYKKYLHARLLELDSPNVDIEYLFAGLLNYHNTQKLYTYIHYILNDIKGSQFITDIYRNVNIHFSNNVIPEKYQKNVDRNKIKFKILRNNAWKSLLDCNENKQKNINLPIEIDKYIKIYNSVHKYLENKIPTYRHRINKFDYKKSIVKMNININKKTYKLKMNLLQASILINIINNKNNVLELSKYINLELKYMNSELNTLIYSKLITRNKNLKNNDTNIVFNINKKFYSDNNEIDLIKTNYELDNLIDNTTNLLKAFTLKAINTISRNITFDKIKKELHNIISKMVEDKNEEFKNFVLYDYILENTLDMLCNENVITKKNDIYFLSNDSDLDNENTSNILDAELSDISDIDNFSDISDSDKSDDENS
jgi:hypothetical protein